MNVKDSEENAASSKNSYSNNITQSHNHSSLNSVPASRNSSFRMQQRNAKNSLRSSAPRSLMDPPSIEAGTPAADALKAIQSVSVTKLDKFARKVQGPKVKKFVKNAATLKGPRYSKRGKPPKVPPYWGRDNEEDYEDYDEIDEDEIEIEVDEEESKRSIEMMERKGSLPSQNDDDFKVDPMESQEKPTSFRFRERRWKRRGGSSSGSDPTKTRKSYVKGKVIDGEHELYALTLAMMLGLRTSIGMTNGQLSDPNGGHKWLNSDDFMAVEKYSFRPKGGDKTPPHDLSHTFKFKDYSPKAFAYIRRLFGINEYDFLSSVCGNANFIEFISNAKSGQFFFYSSDGKFMIKTMTNAESKFLRRILPHYFCHCAENPNTLISKYYGMYRVKMYYLKRNVKFIIMNSVWCTENHIHRTYDLKGSVTGREAGPNETQKDNNVRAQLPHVGFFLTKTVREKIREQLVRDCEFLKGMKILDYSMLIGVHHIRQRANNFGFKDKTTTSRTRALQNSHSIRELLVNKTQSHPMTYKGASEQQRIGNQYYQPLLDEKNKTDFNYSNRPRPASAPDSTAPNQFSRLRTNTLPEGSAAMFAYDGASQGSIGSFSFNPDSYFDEEESSLLDGANETSDTQHVAVETLDKEYATEQMYWPFQRFYDIQGRRRMTPSPAFSKLQRRKDQNYNGGRAGGNHSNEECTLPSFEPPISARKDSGFYMDVSKTKLPIETTGANGKKQYCDGKIFYMGVIDVLQQYNIRKRVEARYHRLKGAGWEDASCVHPVLYADRFLRFYDEYTGATTQEQQPSDSNAGGEMKIEGNSYINQGIVRVTGAAGDFEISDDDSENVEEIVFVKDSDANGGDFAFNSTIG